MTQHFPEINASLNGLATVLLLAAYVAIRKGHDVSAEELIAHSRQHLAEYKCPERVRFLEILPKGPTGKVQRRALKELRAQTVQNV